MIENTPANLAKWHAMVGERIVKRSGKPFKSGKKVGVAMAICVHDHTTNPAFLMDDGSQVECRRCKVADDAALSTMG